MTEKHPTDIFQKLEDIINLPDHQVITIILDNIFLVSDYYYRKSFYSYIFNNVPNYVTIESNGNNRLANSILKYIELNSKNGKKYQFDIV